MRQFQLPASANQTPINLYNHHAFNLTCSICDQTVPLEIAKTEEHGLAVHEECYVLKLSMERSTGVPLHFPRDGSFGGTIQ
jgi:hypothetical protein